MRGGKAAASAARRIWLQESNKSVSSSNKMASGGGKLKMAS